MLGNLLLFAILFLDVLRNVNKFIIDIGIIHGAEAYYVILYLFRAFFVTGLF